MRDLLIALKNYRAAKSELDQKYALLLREVFRVADKEEELDVTSKAILGNIKEEIEADLEAEREEAKREAELVVKLPDGLWAIKTDKGVGPLRFTTAEKALTLLNTIVEALKEQGIADLDAA